MKKLNVALAQTAPVLGNLQKNLECHVEIIDQVAAQGGQLRREGRCHQHQGRCAKGRTRRDSAGKAEGPGDGRGHRACRVYRQRGGRDTTPAADSRCRAR